MKKNSYETWSWVEDVFKIIPLPQLIIALIIAIIIFSIYIFLDDKVKPFEIEFFLIEGVGKVYNSYQFNLMFINN